MRYFIYCRKSSEAEDRQVASIESQLTTLQRTFAERPGIEIVRVFEEAASAKAPGRSQFGEMVSALERGDAQGIIAWAPDRLARNSIDGGRIVYMLDRGAIRDLKFSTYTFENNSQGKFMLQIMFGQSKYYSDALSDNVKRGNRSKVEKGWRPNKPPLGYKSDPATRTIKTDPERFSKIRQLFSLFLNGYSTRQIWQIAREEWDLRTPRCRKVGGRLIALSYVHKILTNPFYAGVLVWGGRSYQGAHEPAISLEDFDRVQSLLRKPDKARSHRRSFAFTGMIHCGECGVLVTAEEKTNRYGSHYTYYHCTRRRTDYRCRQRSISLAPLEAQIHDFLTQLCLPDELHRWAVKHGSAANAETNRVHDERRRALQDAVSRTNASLENLTSLRIRDLISDGEFVRERSKLENEGIRLRKKLDEADKPVDTFEPFDSLVSFGNRAADWFRHGDNQTKRLLLGIVGSNLILKDKRLSIEAKKPFCRSQKISLYPRRRAVREDIRTLWVKNDPELKKIILDIHTLEKKLGIKCEKKASAKVDRRAQANRARAWRHQLDLPSP